MGKNVYLQLVFEKLVSMIISLFITKDSKKMKVKRRLRQTLIAILFVSPMLFYAYYFHDFYISSNPIDWGIFGDYVGGVYSVLVAVLGILITRTLNKKDERQKKKSQ